MRFISTHRSRALLVAVLAGLAVAGIAYATIPDSSGAISGCYDTKTGALRVYDTGSTAIPACSGKEQALTWNQAGPAGPPGPAGTAKAWARIDAGGGVVKSFGFGSATVTHPQQGVYCIQNLPFQPYVAVATAPAAITFDGFGNVVPTGYDVNVTAGTLDTAANPDTFLGICDTSSPGTSQVRVYVANSSGLFDRGFSIFLDG